MNKEFEQEKKSWRIKNTAETKEIFELQKQKDSLIKSLGKKESELQEERARLTYLAKRFWRLIEIEINNTCSLSLNKKESDIDNELVIEKYIEEKKNIIGQKEFNQLMERLKD